MPKTAHKVVVIGHRNPDTDSICSAIAYAELKNKTSSLVCEARRAGRMNQETEFVLKRFGVAPPRMCTDVNPKIRDVDYREMPGIPGSTSLRKAWEIMRDQKIDTLPITSADNELEGIITMKDILEALVGTLPSDSEDPDIVPRKDGSWLIDGQCSFYDFLSHFEMEDLYPDYNYNTLSGLILQQLGHIPKTGESMEWNDFTLEIVDMDGARIDKVLVTLTHKNEEDN